MKRVIAILIDGTAVATAMLDDAARRAGGVTAALGRKPCLATVLVGDDPASRTYVKMKANRCHSIGIDSRRHHLADGASTDEVLELVSRLSHDDAVDGILADSRRGTGPGRWSPMNALSFGR